MTFQNNPNPLPAHRRKCRAYIKKDEGRQKRVRIRMSSRHACICVQLCDMRGELSSTHKATLYMMTSILGNRS
eukprot:1192485-Pyramimonas_sp.AAC.1